MQLRFLLSFVMASLISANALAQTATPKPKGPEIVFDHTIHNFGKIAESIKFASHRYPFTNTGNKTLFIQQVHTSCGCTTPDWTRDSIPQAAKDSSKPDTKQPTALEISKSPSVYIQMQLQHRWCT
jgi:hypothetical protein